MDRRPIVDISAQWDKTVLGSPTRPCFVSTSTPAVIYYLIEQARLVLVISILDFQSSGMGLNPISRSNIYSYYGDKK